MRALLAPGDKLAVGLDGLVVVSEVQVLERLAKVKRLEQQLDRPDGANCLPRPPCRCSIGAGVAAGGVLGASSAAAAAAAAARDVPAAAAGAPLGRLQGPKTVDGPAGLRFEPDDERLAGKGGAGATRALEWKCARQMAAARLSGPSRPDKWRSRQRAQPELGRRPAEQQHWQQQRRQQQAAICPQQAGSAPSGRQNLSRSSTAGPLLAPAVSAPRGQADRCSSTSSAGRPRSG